MRRTLARTSSAGALAVALLAGGPSPLAGQEGHEAAPAHEAAGEHQEHGEHATHGKNEIAVFMGATQRLKFEEDETGFTVGVEYVRQIAERTYASLVFEWADGSIERVWVALLNVGIQPLNGWARPLTFYLGAGVEVASLDEELLELDEHGEAGGDEEHGGEAGHAEPLAEGHASGERETEADALLRVGAGWPIHAGSFSIVPNVNFDLVGEDWAIVGGVTLGLRF